jgi:predicted N-acetyltransferase YhbS
MLEVIGEFAHLAEVNVLPAFSQRGIGHYLVDHALVAARQRGFSGVGLTTFLDLPWNAPFYQKVGFTLVGDEQFPFLERALLEERSAGLIQRVAMFYYF